MIIVTGTPWLVFSQFYGLPYSGVPTGPGGWNDPVNLVTMLGQYFASKENVKLESDVTDNDIVVTANRLEQTLSTTFINMHFRKNSQLNLACVGSVDANEILHILENLNFNITNRNFGPGRAGENIAEPTKNSFTVNVNANALDRFGKHEWGLYYLAFHEIAHSLTAGQTYNNDLWTAYIEGPGKGLSEQEQVDQYPGSTQFKANEARANAVGKSIAESLGLTDFDFPAIHGYENC